MRMRTLFEWYIRLTNKFARYPRLCVRSDEWVQALIYIIQLKHGYTPNCTEAGRTLYTFYGIILATYGIRICERPKAWPFGPVFPRVRLASLNPVGDRNAYERLMLRYPDIVYEGERLFRCIFSRKFLIKRLVEWTTAAGSPWDTTRQRKSFGADIADSDIHAYFARLSMNSYTRME